MQNGEEWRDKRINIKTRGRPGPTYRVERSAVPCIRNLVQKGKILRCVVAQDKLDRVKLDQPAVEFLEELENGRAREDYCLCAP